MKYPIAFFLGTSLALAQLGQPESEAEARLGKLGLARDDTPLAPPLDTKGLGIPAAKTPPPQLPAYFKVAQHRQQDVLVSVEYVAGVAAHIEVYFQTPQPSDAILSLLERYSGVSPWSRQARDAAMAKHFPFVTERGRTFYSAPSAAAWAERNALQGKLVLFIQVADYRERIEQERRRAKESRQG